jgi:nucleoside-diphosphate-sugar epimerase
MSTANTALLVGGDLARRTALLLNEQGFRCIGLRRSTPAQPQPQLQWVQADLCKPDTLVNLPGPISHLLYAVTPDQRTQAAYHLAYVQGLENLLNALDITHLRRAVFVSSTAVYGDSSDWVTEATATEPSGFNGKVLLQAENLLRRKVGDNAVALRLSGIYGPERTQLLQRLRSGTMNLSDQNDQWTNRVHIDDAAGACAHALTLVRPEAVYIVTDDTPVAMGTLYGTLANMLHADFTPPRPTQPAHMSGKRLSNERLKASGYQLKWPDSLQGYRAIIQSTKV